MVLIIYEAIQETEIPNLCFSFFFFITVKQSTFEYYADKTSYFKCFFNDFLHDRLMSRKEYSIM